MRAGVFFRYRRRWGVLLVGIMRVGDTGDRVIQPKKQVGTHRFALRSEEDEAAARTARAGSASGVAGKGAMSNHFRSRQPWKMRFIRSCGRFFFFKYNQNR